jgi:Skp family chaperone for outer membrane proteins
MMHRRRHAKYSPAAGAAGSDTDALQTDVMRFLAIIGLCLMAVFALVQGIPQQEPVKPAQPAQAARIRQEVRAQQQQVEELQTELRALKSELSRTRQLLTDTQKRLQQASGQALQARKQRDRLETRVQNLDRQLQQQRQELAIIEQDSRQKEQDLGELRQRLLKSQLQLDHSRKEIGTLKRPLLQQAASTVSKPQPPANPAPAPTPEKQGFSLRFESDAALDRLVAAGTVTLYAMANQQAWRLSMKTGEPAVAQASFPGWFHEMSALTVPAHYIHSLENAVAVPGQAAIVWGVQLPAATRAAITSFTHGRQGGALLIQGDGQVLLEE